jgi:nucleotide-binding universal stress UspA family protein
MRQVRGRGGVVIKVVGPKDVQLPASRRKVKAGAFPLPVFKLKRILVPLDFSDCSKKALQYAVPFARQFGATLSLLYVIQPYYPVSEMVPMDGELFEQRMRETSEAEMAALRKSLDPALKPSATIRSGTPHVEIVRAARNLKCDLIILSTHGRTGLSHVLMGSTAERVVRHANCPVLVLREHEHEFVKVG